MTVTARPKGEVEHDLAQLAQVFSGPAERVSSRSVNPRIAFSGFRSWWVTLDRNRDFASSSRRAMSISQRSVMSTTTTITSAMLPSLPRTGLG